jgi:hypothetical protein
MSLEDAVGDLAGQLAAAPDTAAQGRELIKVYELLLTDGASYPELPTGLIDALRRALGTVPARAWDQLNTRPRTAYRLIAAGEDVAAWELLTEGVRLARDGVERMEPAHVHVDGGRVFAWLPGFRDPRFGVPDECYELTDDVKLRSRVDTAELTADSLTLAGTAYLTRSVRTGQTERVSLVLSRSGMDDIVVAGNRHRRPDLVSGTGTELRRRAWSGWSVTVALASLPAGSARYRLTLAIEHGALRRTSPIGSATPLAQQEGGVLVRRRRTRWSLDTSASAWSLVSLWERWPKPPLVRGLRTKLRRRAAAARSRRSQQTHR